MRPRHPLLDCEPLPVPTVLEEAEEVTLIIKRADGQTLTATFRGENLATGINWGSRLDREPQQIAFGLEHMASVGQHYDLRLDILDGQSCTFVATNATEEAPHAE